MNSKQESTVVPAKAGTQSGSSLLTAEQIAAERARLVAEAESWIGTPYHTGGRIKGVGCDCLTLVVCAFENAGLIAPYRIPYYPPDWHLHSADERYLRGVQERCVEVPDPCGLATSRDANPARETGVGQAAVERANRIPLPGDLALWKIGRGFAHGAIVIGWPRIVHAEMKARRVVVEDAERATWLQTVGENVAERGQPRPRKFFVLKRWAVALEERTP